MRPDHASHSRRLCLAVLAVLVVGCSGSGDDDGASTTTTATARGPAGEWAVESPEDHGMDPALLEEARAYAFQDDRHTQGVVVVHDGAVVSEWYADGADTDSWTASWSVAKSITSAAIGIAIDEGEIPSVDEPMTTYFPEWEGSDRQDITLRDVLQMSSGLDWDEEYEPDAIAESEVIRMVTGESDQLAYAASRPSRHPTATAWNYSSGDTMLLSGVLEQATGIPADEYARTKLLDPIGMEQYEWWRDAAGHTLTYCCFDSTSRDLARFGQLYLQEGRWGDRQVVPSSWVGDSVQPAATTSAASEDLYGYQWWLTPVDGLPDDMYSALGHNGQSIHVIPSLDLVVVRNGTYVKDPGPPVADPTLFPLYPSDGLVPGKGTIDPATWDTADFLQPIVDSLQAE